MESKILKMLHLETVDPMIFFLVLVVLCIGLFIMLCVNQSKWKKLNQKYTEFMRGKDMESMEDMIVTRFNQIDKMMEDTQKNVESIQMLFENMKSTVQKTGIVKYDAFNEMGGKLSFALAMLDGENNGFVINSMHSREGCYTYVKEIIRGESYIPLGSEETEALNQALEYIEK